MNIYPEKTAIKRWKASRPARLLSKHCLKSPGYLAWKKKPTFNGPSILDWGCGRGDDIEHYSSLKYFNTTVGYDPYWNSTLPILKSFEIITCTYVLNVIPEKNDRIECVRSLLKYLDPNGDLYISVRTPSEIRRLASKNKWKKYKDGFLTSKNTFQVALDMGTIVSYIDAAFGHKLKVQIINQKTKGFDMYCF